jgi:hypothetical protein
MYSAGSGSQSYSYSSTPAAPASSAPTGNSSATLDKYKNSKSISSANFFGSEAQEVDRSRLNQLQGARSISSDAYYGNDTRGRASSGERTCIANERDWKGGADDSFSFYCFDYRVCGRRGLSDAAAQIQGLGQGWTGQWSGQGVCIMPVY